MRISENGSIFSDNPFGNAVYSYGHRNVQGLTWDNQGQLWATEHGRSGIKSGYDELNLIEKGKNYGWPIIQGDEEKNDMIRPVINSGATETWAPAGAIYAYWSIYFTGLRGESIYRAKLSNGQVTDLVEYFKGEFGRLRAIHVGFDGYFYISTSNRGGRGKLNKVDDKIIRLHSNVF